MTQRKQPYPACSSVGSWAFSPAHGESVRILDVQTVWSHTVCQVWIPRKATVERVTAESLSPAQPIKAIGLDRIAYAVAAARIADALTQDVLLAPLEAGVIPLPHQLYALTRAEAERLGEDAFHELYARHQRQLKREQEKGQYAFQVRREALGRLGLPEVRQHRLKRLDDEERTWAFELRKREQVLPELQPVTLLRVEAGNG